MASPKVARKQKRKSVGPEAVRGRERGRTPIRLSVVGGVLMTFGPDGDAVPPSLLQQMCADGEAGAFRMKSGAPVDPTRALAVLDAQQKAPLAKRRSNRWIESLLGLHGEFEPTPAELLTQEPQGEMPPVPEDRRRWSSGAPLD